MTRSTILLTFLCSALCLAPSVTEAQNVIFEDEAAPLHALQVRLDELEKENQAIRAEHHQLLEELQQSEGESLRGEPVAASSYTPGEGVTISMLNDTSQLKLAANLSGLMIFSTKRPFSPGLPLLLLPDSPIGEDTNTFDLHARQSTILAQFSGAEFCGLTPGGTILTLFLNDNLTTDNYGLLLYYAYGELKNERMRFAAGLQEDILGSPGPTVLPVSQLYGSGNPGSYRGQIRMERYFRPAADVQVTVQGGLSEPVATIVRGRPTDPLVEDNGWPNLEGRLALELGTTRQFMGSRTQRPFELGVSGAVGQLRTTRLVGVPPTFTRVEADVRALAFDLQWAVTNRSGVTAEFFTGQTLADYNAGILQNFNSDDFRAIRTTGGYLEIYHYLNPCFHVHCGYGIDDPFDRDLAAGQASSNQTFFNTFLYDVSKTFQMGFEVDYRKTTYVAPALDTEAVLFMSQFLWRF